MKIVKGLICKKCSATTGLDNGPRTLHPYVYRATRQTGKNWHIIQWCEEHFSELNDIDDADDYVIEKYYVEIDDAVILWEPEDEVMK